jgi:hypothetical protein
VRRNRSLEIEDEYRNYGVFLLNMALKATLSDDCDIASIVRRCQYADSSVLYVLDEKILISARVYYFGTKSHQGIWLAYESSL